MRRFNKTERGKGSYLDRRQSLEDAFILIKSHLLDKMVDTINKTTGHYVRRHQVHMESARMAPSRVAACV